MNKLNIVYLFKNNLEKGKKLILQRNNIYNKPIKLKEQILKKAKKTKITKGLYGKYIVIFIETLINKNANFDFNFFKKNIKDLNVIIINKPNTPWSAFYDNKKNIIYIQEKQLDVYGVEVFIYHELLHMLSNLKQKEIQQVGFNKEGLFIGINEGYTQLLTRRYFNASEGAYVIEEKIAILLEFIVSRPLMESIYSKADYLTLIEKINKYDNIFSPSYSLLSSIDMIYRLNPFLWENSFVNTHEFIKSLRTVLDKIITLFINKKSIEKNDNDIDEFFENVFCGIKSSKGNYQVFEKDEINEYKKKCYEVINENKNIK